MIVGYEPWNTRIVYMFQIYAFIMTVGTDTGKIIRSMNPRLIYTNLV